MSAGEERCCDYEPCGYPAQEGSLYCSPYCQELDEVALRKLQQAEHVATMTTPDKRCSRCDRTEDQHMADDLLRRRTTFCPGFYVSPKPSPETVARAWELAQQDAAANEEIRAARLRREREDDEPRPYALTLTRHDGTTVEVRTRLEWKATMVGDIFRTDHPSCAIYCKSRVDVVAVRKFDWFGGITRAIEQFSALADDLRAIREAMRGGDE